MRKDVWNRLLVVLARCEIDTGPLQPDTRLGRPPLALDSLLWMKVLLELEREFDADLPPDEVWPDGPGTLAALTDYIGQTIADAG